MAIRPDSYSSVDEVFAFTRHLADGASGFTEDTRPTQFEVEKFIDRASGMLNVALAQVGLATPISNSTAKLACSDWVTDRATEYVELTQRGVGYSDGEGSRVVGFRNLQKSAIQFAQEFRLGLARLGVTVTHGKAEGLQFTGLNRQSERTDRTDTDLEQPKFGRGLFDDRSTSQFNEASDD